MVTSRHQVLSTLLLAAVLAGGLAWWNSRHQAATSPASQDLPGLLEQLAEGHSDALAKAVQAAKADTPAAVALLSRKLYDDSWAVRAAACRIAAGLDDEAVYFLLPRASDEDWHVRSVAYEELWRLYLPAFPPPAKDMPIAQREQILLRWLAGYEAQATRKPSAQLSNLYGDNRHVEYGQTLTDRCLECHVGRAPAAFAANDKCVQCHADIYAQWAGSAHAQSLSHLKFRSVDPTSRSSQWMSFGEFRGISCQECHGLTAAAATSSATRTSRCTLGALRPASSEAACGRCHQPTFEQWQQWKHQPHAQKLDWPPGQMAVRGGDERSCAACHMPRPDSLARHSWPARRDQELLASAIDVSFRRHEGQLEVVLTNLAGHEVPTDSRFHDIAVDLVSPQGTRTLVTLALPWPPGIAAAQRQLAAAKPSQPPSGLPLGVGESRHIVLDEPAPGGGIQLRLLRHSPAATTENVFLTVPLP